MLQVLLADRFKLAIHYETRRLPAFGMALVKSGKLGPHLQQHAGGCALFDRVSFAPPTPGAPTPPATVAGGFPAICSSVVTQESAIGRVLPRRSECALGDVRSIRTGRRHRTVINAPQLTGSKPAGA